jgi:GWxTD domain-containing protein
MISFFRLASIALLGAWACLYGEAANPSVEQARQMILQKNYDGAATALRGLTVGNPGEANYYLGLALIGQENKQEAMAQSAACFTLAARAGYHLPFDAWDNYPVLARRYLESNSGAADDILGSKDPKKKEIACHLLENVLSADHLNRKISTRLGELYLENGQYSQAVDLFRRIRQANPAQDETVYGLGLGFLDFSTPDLAKKFQDAYSSIDRRRLPPLTRLLLARAAFVLEDNATGCVLYSQCLDSLDEITAVELYRDVTDLVPEKERDGFLKADSLSQKKNFFSRFWKSRDPLAGSTFNERLVEHYRRLDYSKQHFNVFLYNGYDDRGKIYIKHGEPDEKVSMARCLELNDNLEVYDNVSWLYRRRPRNFIYHFAQKGIPYVIVSNLAEVFKTPTTDSFMQMATESKGCARDLFLGRAELDPLYFKIASAAELNQTELGTMALEEALVLEPALTVGEATETYNPNQSEAALNYYYSTADFMDPSRGADLSIYYGLPVSELTFNPAAAGVNLQFESTFAVFDRNWEQVKRTYNRRNLNLKQAPNQEDKAAMLLDRQMLNLPGGTYHYAVRVKDLASNRVGTYRGDFEVTAYQPQKFNVSQVLLASSVEPNKPGGKFAIGDLNVMPMPSQTFRRDQPVFIYYEIYSLGRNAEGRKRFNVDFAIEADKLDRNLASKIVSSLGSLVRKKEDKGKITLTFDKETNSPGAVVQPEYISIDIKDSPPGLYNLNITVTDIASGEKITRNAMLSIVNAK